MIQATQRLSELLQSSQRIDYTIVRAHIKTIVEYGDVSDADVLLKVFLDDSINYNSSLLLNAIAVLGNEQHARILTEECLDNNLLKKDFCSEIFHTIGYIGYDPAKEILLNNALYADYFSSRDAVLGLLHLDCSEYQSEIKKGIESIYGKHLFNEFIPALTYKLHYQDEVLQKLYEYGSTVVSTDSNAGIILAFSLCGDLGREYFEQVIWHPHWETLPSGTGTHYWTYIGTQNLRITLNELYAQVKESKYNEILEHRLYVFDGLLSNFIEQTEIHPFRFIKANKESYESVYENLFMWKTPNEANNILDLARKVGLHNTFFDLERRLTLRVEEEVKSVYKNKIP